MKEKLIGTWQLAEFLIESPEGRVSEWRKNARGSIKYRADGSMSIDIRSELAEEHSQEEYLNSILQYSGPYELQDKNTVIHFVEEASLPERVGQELRREISVKGNELRIVGRGEFGVARLLWKKLI